MVQQFSEIGGPRCRVDATEKCLSLSLFLITFLKKQIAKRAMDTPLFLHVLSSIYVSCIPSFFPLFRSFFRVFPLIVSFFDSMYQYFSMYLAIFLSIFLSINLSIYFMDVSSVYQCIFLCT